MRMLDVVAITSGRGVLSVRWDFILILMTMGSSAWAGAGTTIFSFLQIPVSARGLALGGSATALADDAALGSTNPAGFPRRTMADAMISRTFYWQDVTFDHVAGTVKLSPNFLIGGEMIGTGYGKIARAVERTDGTLDETASGAIFDAFAMAFAVRAAYRMDAGFPLSAGIGIRWAKEQLDSDGLSAFMVDAGVIIDHIWGWAARQIRAESINIGASITRIGGPVQGSSLPTTGRAGVAIEWNLIPLTTVFDMEWPFAQTPRWQAGVESWVWDQLAFRIGYRSGPDRPHVTVGVGFQILQEKVGYHLDYALEASGVLGGTHRISLGIQFR